jgi:hypothetical protein
VFEPDDEFVGRLQASRLDAASQQDVVNIDPSMLSQTDLLILRGKIDALLPTMSMREMDIEKEVVRQFRTVQSLQAMALSGNEESNKKAAVVNACVGALTNLAKLQIEIQTSERFKRIEALMLKYMKRLPKEVAEAFITDYKNLILEGHQQ